MRSRRLLVMPMVLIACAAGVGGWGLSHAGAAGCTSDADCNDGVFCNGTETCDLATGSCAAVSACPPGIDGCVQRGVDCDEDNDRCVDLADDNLCDDGVFCNGTETCDIVSGGCMAVSACPPFIDGCLEGGSCDEDNDRCTATPNSALCPAGQACAPDGECVTPTEILQGLSAEVQGLQAAGVLNRGQANALRIKLEHAQSKLSSVACDLLRAFIAQVTSFESDGILTAAQASSLIQGATSARSALGCP